MRPGNLSPTSGPVACPTNWLLANGRHAVSPPPTLNRLTSFSSWLTPTNAPVDGSPDSLPPPPVSPAGIGWRPPTTTHATTASTLTAYRRLMPSTAVSMSPLRTAGSQYQQAPPTVADSAAYYAFDAHQPLPQSDAAASGVGMTTTATTGSVDIYVTPRHNAIGGSISIAAAAAMSVGGGGSIPFDRPQQTGNGNGESGAVGASCPVDRFYRTTANPSAGAAPGAEAQNIAAGVGYRQQQQQQQSPLIQAMYGSLRRGTGKMTATSAMSSSSSSTSLQHRDLQEVSA